MKAIATAVGGLESQAGGGSAACKQGYRGGEPLKQGPSRRIVASFPFLKSPVFRVLSLGSPPAPVLDEFLVRDPRDAAAVRVVGREDLRAVDVGLLGDAAVVVQRVAGGFGKGLAWLVSWPASFSAAAASAGPASQT